MHTDHLEHMGWYTAYLCMQYDLDTHYYYHIQQWWVQQLKVQLETKIFDSSLEEKLFHIQ